MEPTPTLKDVKQHFRKQNAFGSYVCGTESLKDDAVFLDIAPAKETVLGLVSSNCISVQESGYYNGVYEQDGEHEGRPKFKMIQADNDKAGPRYIFYTSHGTVPGWKFNKQGAHYQGWDMLARDNDAVADVGEDIPEGKFRLDNGGSDVKPNAPRVSRLLHSRTEEDLDRLKLIATRQEKENIEGTEAGGCFNAEALILMSDGSHKQARDVRVGDDLRSASTGGTTKVEACIVESQDTHQLVQIGNLLITPHHPVLQAGHWIFPHRVPGAVAIDANMELHNFITSNREAIHVEGYIATSVGTYCEGLHDIEQNAEHRVWGTDLIVNIYRQHPQWPNIVSNTAATVAAVDAALRGTPAHLWHGCYAEVGVTGHEQKTHSGTQQTGTPLRS